MSQFLTLVELVFISLLLVCNIDEAIKDCALERRSPELIFCFYTLDVSAIEIEFRKCLDKTKGWSLLGTQDSHSCASLAWAVLVSGGIGRYISAPDRVVASSVGSVKRFFFLNNCRIAF